MKEVTYKVGPNRREEYLQLSGKKNIMNRNHSFLKVYTITEGL
jgi:hypothetical protein